MSKGMDPVARPTSETTSDYEFLNNQILTLMGQMPAAWSEALKLKINGQLSYADIATVMDATRDQVRTWIYRGRRFLESELKLSSKND